MKKLFITFILCSTCYAGVMDNGDGTITIYSDSNPSIKQIISKGSNQIFNDELALFPLIDWQNAKQLELDAFFDANFDLKAFIRAGTATPVTGAQVGNFLATITDNYRSLRSQIQLATTATQVNAINVQSGWPGNP